MVLMLKVHEILNNGVIRRKPLMLIHYKNLWYYINIIILFKMLFISVKFLDTKVSQAWVWSEQEDGWKKQISIGCCQQRIYISRGAITNGKKFYSFRGWCLEVSICMGIIIIHICIYLSREHLSASVLFMEVWSNFLIFIYFFKKNYIMVMLLWFVLFCCFYLCKGLV